MSKDPVQAFVRKSTIVAWTLFVVTALIAVVVGVLVFQAAADIEESRVQLEQTEAELPEALEAVEAAQRAADAASRTVDQVTDLQSFGSFGQGETISRALDREADALAELTRAESAYTATLTRAESLRIAAIAGESSLAVQTVGGIAAVVTSALLTVAFFVVSWFARALTVFPRSFDPPQEGEPEEKPDK